MNLTGKQLVEQGIITGPVDEVNIQQHGIDLNLISVAKINGRIDQGEVPFQGKTKIASRQIVPLIQEIKGSYWDLEQGAYDIILAQGCRVPSDKMLLIRQRSSLLRNGTIIHSSIFDAGFVTERIGTVMIVMTPIKIYSKARVAQIYAHNSNFVENLYN